MVTSEDLPFNASVSFSTYAPQVLTDGFTNAKVKGTFDADTARLLGIDPVAMHAQVYPFLPPGTIDRYDAYQYVKLTLSNGQNTAIGLPWIDAATLRILGTRKIQLTLDNVVPADEPKVIAALAANGFRAVDVRLID